MKIITISLVTGLVCLICIYVHFLYAYWTPCYLVKVNGERTYQLNSRGKTGQVVYTECYTY